MNSEFVKDLSKAVNKNTVSTELTPGTTPRRYTPSGGERKHREKIHRESEMADSRGNLPFSFSKPKKPKRQAIFECEDCGFTVGANINTVGMVCRGCGKYVSVKEIVYV